MSEMFTPLYLLQLQKQLEQHGRFEEKQLLARWQSELSVFFTCAQKGLMGRQQRLEIGLENALVLKLVLKATQVPALGMLLEYQAAMPTAFQPLLTLLLQKPRRYHYGIRLNTDSVHRELYVYDQQGDVSQTLGGLPDLPNQLVATAYSLDEHQGISCYCTSDDNPNLHPWLQQRLAEVEARLNVRLMAQVDAGWQHYRLQKGAWQLAKIGFEMKRSSPQLRQLLLVHAKAPYFHYLVPKQMPAPAVLAASVDGKRLGCYFTVL